MYVGWGVLCEFPGISARNIPFGFSDLCVSKNMRTKEYVFVNFLKLSYGILLLLEVLW